MKLQVFSTASKSCNFIVSRVPTEAVNQSWKDTYDEKGGKKDWNCSEMHFCSENICILCGGHAQNLIYFLQYALMPYEVWTQQYKYTAKSLTRIGECSGLESQGFLVHFSWIYFKPGIHRCRWWVGFQVRKGCSQGGYLSPAIMWLRNCPLKWMKLVQFLWFSKQEIPLNKWRAAAASASQPRTRRARTARDIHLVMEQLDNNMDCCVAFDRNNLTPHYSPDAKFAALLLDFVSNRSHWDH